MAMTMMRAFIVVLLLAVTLTVVPEVAAAQTCRRTPDLLGGWRTTCADGFSSRTSSDLLGGYRTSGGYRDSYGSGSFSSRTSSDLLGGYRTDPGW
jgi:hypothetical protein